MLRQMQTDLISVHKQEQVQSGTEHESDQVAQDVLVEEQEE